MPPRTLMAGLNEAANQTASLKTATGRHHFSLAVYADDVAELDGIVADASKTLVAVRRGSPDPRTEPLVFRRDGDCLLRATPRHAALQAAPRRHLDARSR